MAIKSKKRKPYKTCWKIAAVSLFFVCAMLLFFVGVVAVNTAKNWDMDVLLAETVYDTKEFSETFSDALAQAVAAEIQYRSEERILAGEAVNREELLQGFKRYYGIVDGVITANTVISDTYDTLSVSGTIPLFCRKICRSMPNWWKAVCRNIIRCISSDS